MEASACRAVAVGRLAPWAPWGRPTPVKAVPHTAMATATGKIQRDVMAWKMGPGRELSQRRLKQTAWNPWNKALETKKAKHGPRAVISHDVTLHSFTSGSWPCNQFVYAVLHQHHRMIGLPDSQQLT